MNAHTTAIARAAAKIMSARKIAVRMQTARHAMSECRAVAAMIQEGKSAIRTAIM